MREISLKTMLINLDSSKERYLSAKQQLDKAGMAFERVSAFDGRKSVPTTFPEYDENKALSWFGRKLSGSELGCYFSHIDCTKRFLTSEADYGLTLEDDLLLHADVHDTLTALLKWLNEGHAPSWYMINLGRPVKRFESTLKTFETLEISRQFCKAHYFPDTTTAILWSREGAQNFLKTADQIYMPIDHFLRRWNCETDAGYGFLEPPITTTGAESDIERAKLGQDTSRASFYQLRKHRRLWANKRAAKRNRVEFQEGLPLQ